MSKLELSGISLKLQRACEQLDSLQKEMAVFLDGNPYEPAIYFHTTQFQHRGKSLGCLTDFTVRMLVHNSCHPIWSIKIGEIVHNFRSALDHAVFQLYIFLNEKFPPENSRLQFPIFVSPSKFDSDGLRMLKGIGNKATKLIKFFQPFSTGEDEASPLWHLNKVSNFDKHRMLNLTGGTIEAFDFKFPPLVNPGTIFHRIRKRGAFQHNTIIAEGSFTGSGHPFGGENVKVQADCLFNIVFDEGTPVVGGWPVIGTLRDIACRTSSIVEQIESQIFGVEAKLPHPSEIK